MYERSELPQVRQFKPYCLPESLDDLVGPSEGALVLPLYLHWAKQEGVTVDLGVMSRDVVESVEGYAANRRVVSVVVVEVEPAGQRQASFGL